MARKAQLLVPWVSQCCFWLPLLVQSVSTCSHSQPAKHLGRTQAHQVLCSALESCLKGHARLTVMKTLLPYIWSAVILEESGKTQATLFLYSTLSKAYRPDSLHINQPQHCFKLLSHLRWFSLKARNKLLTLSTSDAGKPFRISQLFKYIIFSLQVFK